MCGCFDISDFVCFFTFFITAIVALICVQYFFVFLDFETDDKIRLGYLGRSMYFLILTLLGCLIFAGVQRRSICLLRWPSRILVFLITAGILFLIGFLWTFDRVYKQNIRDLELKTVELSIVIALVISYLVGVHRLIAKIQGQRARAYSSANINFVLETNGGSSNSRRGSSSNVMDAVRLKQEKVRELGLPRQFNADKHGVNYYKLLLEGGGGGGGSKKEEIKANVHRTISLTLGRKWSGESSGSGSGNGGSPNPTPV